METLLEPGVPCPGELLDVLVCPLLLYVPYLRIMVGAGKNVNMGRTGQDRDSPRSGVETCVLHQL